MITVMSLNIDGITDEKLDSLFLYLRMHSIDVCHLQETQVPSFPDYAYNKGYQIFHSAPLRGKSGGCATLVLDKWSCKQLPTFPDEGDVCWTSIDTGNEVYVSANVYLRGSLNDPDYTETLTAVIDRLANLRSLRTHVMLMGDLNVEASRATDQVKHAITENLVCNCSMYRVDLQAPLDDLPTHIPWQAGEQQRHLDALAVDERVRSRVASSGIDLDGAEPLIPLSDHRPLWVSFMTRTRKVPSAAPPIVFKTSEATAEH